jgi:signal peptidase
MMLAIEIIRWRILNSHGRPRSTFSIVLAWLLPFALTLPLARLSELGNPEQAFSLAGSVIVPAAGQSLLATALSGLGGPFAALAYRAIPLVFEFASPVLPTLSWQIAAVLGVAVPLVGMFLTADLAEDKAGDDEETGRKGFSVSPADLVIVCVGVAVLWFNTGLLGVRPALISGHSMEPLLTTGDIVVCKNVSPTEVVVGDVIRFKSGEATVMHRVVEIQEDAQGRRTFITWGDNNNAIDQPVDESQVMGRAIFFLRKVGWLAIWPGQLLKGIFGR